MALEINSAHDQSTKLDPELKAQWLTALRSGKYQQGRGGLLDMGDGDKAFCCLGVLGHLCGATDNSLQGSQILEDVYMSHLLGGWNPESKGFYPFDPARPETHITLQRRLAAMNDNGKSFAEIADWIEANL